MNTRPTFEQTLDVLVKAYLNDTLEHANCSACAVGNLVAHAIGTAPVLSKHIKNGGRWMFLNGDLTEWQYVFCSVGFTQQCNQYAYYGEAQRQIDATGYTWPELARIERAFEERSDRFNMDTQTPEYIDQKMFDGLMAVVDVLADIHGISLEKKEEAKLMFVK